MIRARLIGMEDISNRPIPLFAIPRAVIPSTRERGGSQSTAVAPPFHAEAK